MSSSKKKTKKLFGKAFTTINALKSKKKLTTKKASGNETPDLSSTTLNAIESQGTEADEDSDIFHDERVRASTAISDDGFDQFSLDGDFDAQSNESSLFTDEEDDAKERRGNNHEPRCPREVGVGNPDYSSSDDDDDLYLEEDESICELHDPAVDEESGEDSDEEEGGDTFDMNADVGAPSHHRPVNPRAARGGVTQSVIAYTTGGSLAASISQIDKMMDVRDSIAIRDPDEAPDVEHEDSSELLAHFRNALSFKDLDPDPDALKQGEELESELEKEMHETDKLEHELETSSSNNKALEEKLNACKAKMRRIEEKGEQVHMARGFALQSVKLGAGFTLEKPTRTMTTSRGTSLDNFSISEEEDETDESDEESHMLGDMVIVEEEEETDESDEEEIEESDEESDEVVATAAIDETEEAAKHDERVHSNHTTATTDEKHLTEEGHSRRPPEGLQTPHRTFELGLISEEEPHQADETPVVNEAEESEGEQGKADRELALEEDAVRKDANTAVKSPEDKRRASMQKARQMEEVGEQLRQDRFQEVGEAEPDYDYSPLREQDFSGANGDLRTRSQQADMQMAEVIELRERLKKQQEQIESLEEARDYNSSKVAELSRLLKRAGTDDMYDHLAQRSVQVAELNHEISMLRKRLAHSEDRGIALEAERDANKTVIANLSESLWNDGPLKGSKEETEYAAHALMKQGGLIPENDAMEMTIVSLQEKIETLEEEKAAFRETLETLTASAEELMHEKDAGMLKISALESQFLVLNKRGHSASADPLDSPDRDRREKLLRFKAWANNKINQAHEQYDTIKTVTTNPDQIL